MILLYKYYKCCLFKIISYEFKQIVRTEEKNVYDILTKNFSLIRSIEKYD